MTDRLAAPDLDRLEGVVELLNRGNWRRATEELQGAVDAGRVDAVVGVVVCLRCVCRCMRLQCASGDVQGAHDELERAARTLARLGIGLVGSTRPTPEPDRAGLPLRHLLWVTDRLVQRERADLEAVRMIFGDIGKGRPEFVHACVEHLIWVEFDPWTARVHPRDQQLLDLDNRAYARFRTMNALDITRRATNLRQLVGVRAGSVSRRTWSRMGGDAAVREAALLVLAEEDDARGNADRPVRLGRLRACEYARTLAADTLESRVDQLAPV